MASKLEFSDLDAKWKVAVEKFQMMPDVHSDIGAEDWFTISRKHVRYL